MIGILVLVMCCQEVCLDTPFSVCGGTVIAGQDRCDERSIRIVDAGRGKPVPFFLVDVVNEAGQSVTLMSDAGGVLRLPSEGGGAITELVPLDYAGGRRVFGVVKGPALEGGEVSLEVGPTVFLGLEPSATEYGVFVEGGARANSLFPAGEEFGDAIPVRFYMGRAWVRLPMSCHDKIELSSTRLLIVDREGLALGSSLGLITDGLTTEGAVPIEFSRSGVLVLRDVSSSAGKMVTLGVEVNGQCITRVGSREWEVKWVTPGRYTVYAEARDRGHQVLGVEPRMGEVNRYPLLGPGTERVAPMIAGEVRLASGGRDSALSVRVQGGGAECARTKEIMWTRDRRGGGDVGVFAFYALEGGSYEVSVVGGYSNAVTPAQVVVQAPRRDVAFVVDDDIRPRDIVFDVVDARSGAQVRKCFLILSPEDCEARLGALLLPGYESGSLVRPAPLSQCDWAWQIRVDGYMPAEGLLSSVDKGPSGPLPERVAVTLHPGGSGLAIVKVVDARGRPVLSARVSINGGSAVPVNQFGGVAKVVTYEEERGPLQPEVAVWCEGCEMLDLEASHGPEKGGWEIVVRMKCAE